jgi:hypothetical protein
VVHSHNLILLFLERFCPCFVQYRNDIGWQKGCVESTHLTLQIIQFLIVMFHFESSVKFGAVVGLPDVCSVWSMEHRYKLSCNKNPSKFT